MYNNIDYIECNQENCIKTTYYYQFITYEKIIQHYAITQNKRLNGYE